ncbi:MAG: hypothetical protein M5U17_02980 [Ignavibacterium sp.]|nr:hypothetical protein [Ignavibacterium sp.]
MKNFSYPYKSIVLFFSAFMIFLPVFILGPFGYEIINSGNKELLRYIILIPSLLACCWFYLLHTWISFQNHKWR